MIIDDEVGVRELLADALKLAGFETIAAADAMIAQTLLCTTKPDLLIVDINMPLMDGFEFIERIRGNGDNTPALMLSARGDRADITRGLTLGADDYVTKPFGLEELVLRVRAILRRSQFVEAVPTVLSCGPITLDQLRSCRSFTDRI
jgi:two-component system OmpR family response regulator